MEMTNEIKQLSNLTEQRTRLEHGIRHIENNDFSYLEDTTLHGNNYILALNLIDKFDKYEFYSNIKTTILNMLKALLEDINQDIEKIKDKI